MIYQVEFKSKVEINGCYDCFMYGKGKKNNFRCPFKEYTRLSHENKVSKKPRWCPLKKVEVQDEQE
jgi:hypothetical protein